MGSAGRAPALQSIPAFNSTHRGMSRCQEGTPRYHVENHKITKLKSFLTNLGENFFFVSATEYGFLAVEFSENTAQGPHVNLHTKGETVQHLQSTTRRTRKQKVKVPHTASQTVSRTFKGQSNLENMINTNLARK